MKTKQGGWAALLLGLAAATAVAGAGDLTGTWTLTSTTPRGERTSTLVLTQKGTALSVTLTGERGESTGSGKVEGDTVEWTLTRQTPMGEVTLTYRGKVTGDTMAGEVQMMDRTTPWKAVRTAAAAAAPATRSAAAAVQRPAPPSPPTHSRQVAAPAPPAQKPVAAEPRPMALVKVGNIEPPPEKVRAGLQSITARELAANLAFLSSDALEGRETGTTGHRVAAEYAAMMMSLWGLTPAGDPPPRPRSRSAMGPPPAEDEPTRSFLQRVELKEIVDSQVRARVDWRDGDLARSRWFEKDVDFELGERGSGFGGSQTISAPVVFVGYGISEKQLGYDDYAGVDVKGKIVMMLSGLPPAAPGSPLASDDIKRKYDPPAAGRRNRFGPSAREQAARQAGAVAVLLVEGAPERNGDVARRVLDSKVVDDEEAIIPGGRRRLALPAPPDQSFEPLPTLRVSRQMADEILTLAGTRLAALEKPLAGDSKPRPLPLRGVVLTLESQTQSKLVQSVNVLGYVEGSDPGVKDEVVVVGAHLDHLGRRGDYIFNGADDNGSGAVAVLAIARAFAETPARPRRNVLFALWTGEEEGLLGSRHYVLHPTFPLDKTVAVINLDMVSRPWDKERLARFARMIGDGLKEEDLAAIDVDNFVSFAFRDASGRVRPAAEEANRHVGLTMVVRESEQDAAGTGGSDHAPFGARNVPWVFLFAGMSEDYHRPSDTVEKTRPELVERIARLAFQTAFSLADGV